MAGITLYIEPRFFLKPEHSMFFNSLKDNGENSGFIIQRKNNVGTALARAYQTSVVAMKEKVADKQYWYFHNATITDFIGDRQTVLHHDKEIHLLINATFDNIENNNLDLLFQDAKQIAIARNAFFEEPKLKSVAGLLEVSAEDFKDALEDLLKHPQKQIDELFLLIDIQKREIKIVDSEKKKASTKMFVWNEEEDINPILLNGNRPNFEDFLNGD
ncbi:MAG: hypothetical protein LBV67_09640 [Streptococcaceae bacterium]|jgi:Asp-tRNA(Asn)/Glu-tRNA(Gln) amidotransferase B subunit|nr:hypothetical protein [Streptococcaceae bacterium]